MARKLGQVDRTTSIESFGRQLILLKFWNWSFLAVECGQLSKFPYVCKVCGQPLRRNRRCPNSRSAFELLISRSVRLLSGRASLVNRPLAVQGARRTCGTRMQRPQMRQRNSQEIKNVYYVQTSRDDSQTPKEILQPKYSESLLCSPLHHLSLPLSTK